MRETRKQIKIFKSAFDYYEKLFLMEERGNIVERRFFIQLLTKSATRYLDILRWLSKFYDVNAYRDKHMHEGKVKLGVYLVGNRERVEIFCMMMGQIICAIEKDCGNNFDKKRKACREILLCLDEALEIKKKLPIPYVANKKRQAEINYYAKMYVRSISLKKKFRANYGNR